MVCALGAAVCFGTATVLQAMAARVADTGRGGEAALLLRALRQWRYVAGLGLDGVGFLLQIAALRSVPIYAVGAALAASLAVTAVVAARLLRVQLSRVEWGAVGVVCAGLAMLGLASGAEGQRGGSAALEYAVLGTAVAVLLLGFAGGRLPRLSGRARALVLGLGAGFGFGVVEVAVRLVDDPNVGALVANPAVYALPLGGGAAFLLLTSALGRGSVTVATAGMVLGETVGPALVGVVWLGDRTRPGLAWLAVLGFAVAVAGALALTRFGEAPVASGDEVHANSDSARFSPIYQRPISQRSE
ncbi:hypothetical protein [Streptomyces sp. TRM68367]|uniref:hypothetical protein n=1 Tax=Streptomyces sp. TRM68367 TaxID=2758415 RepID=UPI0021CE97E6|nr:hypothetical protein [Streptomyces sp. TRM68367]